MANLVDDALRLAYERASEEGEFEWAPDPFEEIDNVVFDDVRPSRYTEVALKEIPELIREAAMYNNLLCSTPQVDYTVDGIRVYTYCRGEGKPLVMVRFVFGYNPDSGVITLDEIHSESVEDLITVRAEESL